MFFILILVAFKKKNFFIVTYLVYYLYNKEEQSISETLMKNVYLLLLLLVLAFVEIMTWVGQQGLQRATQKRVSWVWYLTPFCVKAPVLEFWGMWSHSFVAIILRVKWKYLKHNCVQIICIKFCHKINHNENKKVTKIKMTILVKINNMTINSCSVDNLSVFTELSLV